MLLPCRDRRTRTHVAPEMRGKRLLSPLGAWPGRSGAGAGALGMTGGDAA